MLLLVSVPGYCFAKICHWSRCNILIKCVKTGANVFIKNGPFTAYFSLFSSFQQMFDKSLPMTGFEPRISGVGGDCSTTESQPLPKATGANVINNF